MTIPRRQRGTPPRLPIKKKKIGVYNFFAIAVVIVITVACSSKKAEEQKAPEMEIAELKAEHEIAHIDMAVPSPDSAYEQVITYSEYPPPYVNYDKFLNYNLTDYSDMRIWGWSRDGKAAYSNYISFEGDRIFVYIFDLIDDKILWENYLYFWDDPHIGYENYDYFTSNFYLNFINDFKNVCIQNKIEFIQTEFMELPIRHNNQTVNIIMEKEVVSRYDLEMDNTQYGGTVKSFRIIAENQGKHKTFYERYLQMYAQDVVVYGYFISPFENRALIVAGIYSHWWEGSAVGYFLTGCHLSIGF